MEGALDIKQPIVERRKGVLDDQCAIGSVAMFFDSWIGLGRVIVVGALAYFALVVTLRLSGKRTLSKLSAFDLVVTVALGSTLSTVLLTKDVALAEGVLAFVLLVLLQFLLARASTYSQRFEAVIKSEPSLLLYRGQLLGRTMRKERITDAEVLAALRAGGLSAPDQAEAVVLEADGSMTVVPRGKAGAQLKQLAIRSEEVGNERAAGSETE